jgi:hypothetical protein
MESLKKVTNAATSTALATLQLIKREEQRLAIRLLAVDRCARTVKYASEHAEVEDSEEETEFEDLIANVEAVRYDLNTYMRQLHDRVANIERGIAEAGEGMSSESFVRYIEEDARLCARDIALAREGYDDLIENLQAISHLRDQE